MVSPGLEAEGVGGKGSTEPSTGAGTACTPAADAHIDISVKLMMDNSLPGFINTTLPRTQD